MSVKDDAAAPAPPVVGSDTAPSSTPEPESQNVEKEIDPPRPAPPGDHGLRKVVRNFTPSWFAVTMGTGIVGVLLHDLPYNAPWLQIIAIIFFILNIILFCLFCALTAFRYVMYPEIWMIMVDHPSQSLFIGTLPMSFALIINMMILMCKGWGNWLVYTAWGFWWVDVALSMATCITMPFIVMHHHKPALKSISAALLLPTVPAVVAAASGGLIASALPNPDHVVITLVTSYVLWGIGQATSFVTLALYFHRLTVHSLPPREAIVSVFLPIGPLCQGAIGIMELGEVALRVLPVTGAFGPPAGQGLPAPDTLHPGEIYWYLGIFIAFCLWGFSLLWLAFAIISIATMHKFPFNMGWWGFTFPVGSLAACTILMGENLSSPFFKVLGMIISASVFLLWIFVAALTVRDALTGKIFFAPCLLDLRPKAEQSGGDRKV